ncbi:farnesyl pyrophosphate synthase isoform X2 [Solenopsis invicta]|nr:farnesyl pyrophosphate synthase isoform X2 [Solenopsis invicta]XP_039307285.1 farnesyl pyrophosphate synthase isoform X2 [Solenopsis invicta]XP_039307288.1 farnesyl pyrophosphate synthase isoform X2 [Solenopsis invicta]
MLHYNVPKGKKSRALAFINAYKLLMPNDKLTQDNINSAWIFAWCIEMMQISLLMFDDMMDRSLFRRGQLCWYRHNVLGLAAVKDCTFLLSATDYLIRKYFKEKEYYIDLLELFHNIIFHSAMGQSLDLLTTNFNNKLNLNTFTIDRYNSMAANKTAPITYILPINAALRLAGIKDQKIFSEVNPILLEMGLFFQVQDDYLACFGNSEICGKDNTDIQEGKCSWLIVVALQRATPEQRRILEECYGVSDPEKIKRVMQVFIDLDLPNVYSMYEKETYNLISAKIRQISCNILQSILQNSLDKTYGRIA